MSTNNLHEMVGRLEGKMDQALVQLSQLNGRHTSMDRRVRHLESFKARVLGIAAAVSVGVSVMVWVVKTWVANK